MRVPKNKTLKYAAINGTVDKILKRGSEAIEQGDKAVDEKPTYVVFNGAVGSLVGDKALKANPVDARLVYERDQLWKRLSEKPAVRLRELEKRIDLVRQRDDLSVEICALYNQTGQHEKALVLVSARNFQPWEGGEGGPLGQWVRSHLALGQVALKANDCARAAEHFSAALTAPPNLGEAKHLLANQSDIHFWLGCALAAETVGVLAAILVSYVFFG